MEKLTKFQTHKLIKQALPEAKTVYEAENKSQITMEEWKEIKWAEEEALLKEQSPELFNCFLNNIILRRTT